MRVENADTGTSTKAQASDAGKFNLCLRKVTENKLKLCIDLAYHLQIFCFSFCKIVPPPQCFCLEHADIGKARRCLAGYKIRVGTGRDNR